MKRRLVGGLFFFTKSVKNRFYIDATNGNDSNSGKKSNDAFKTLSKINSLELSPEAKIYLKRGEIWKETLSPSLHEGWVSFDAYGDGAKPIINGSALDHSMLLENPFFNFSNIVFDGATGVSNETVRANTHDLIFINCEFINSANYLGFGSWSSDGSENYNIQLLNCKAYNNYTSGVFIGADTGQYGCKDILIEGGEYYSNGHSVDSDHGIYVQFGAIVRKVVAHNNSSAGIKINCEGVYTSEFLPTIERCSSYNNYFGYYIGHNKAEIRNNLGYSNTVNNMYLDGDARENKIYHNTLVNSANSCFSVGANIAGANNIVKNNIMIEDDSVVGYQWVLYGSSMDGLAAQNTFNNNLYYSDGKSTTDIFRTRTFAEWKAMPNYNDADSLSELPLFVNSYDNLRLNPNSPCKGKGENLGITIDFDDNPRATPPSIGAFE